MSMRLDNQDRVLCAQCSREIVFERGRWRHVINGAVWCPGERGNGRFAQPREER